MKRPKLVPISEEMHRMCVMLGEEMLGWPQVRTHPMFGMRAFYRGKIVFAILPEKRAFEDANTIMYKIANETKKSEGKKWKLFDIQDTENLSAALTILQKAYRNAKPARTKK